MEAGGCAYLGLPTGVLLACAEADQFISRAGEPQPFFSKQGL